MLASFLSLTSLQLGCSFRVDGTLYNLEAAPSSYIGRSRKHLR